MTDSPLLRHRSPERVTSDPILVSSVSSSSAPDAAAPAPVQASVPNNSSFVPKASDTSLDHLSLRSIKQLRSLSRSHLSCVVRRIFFPVLENRQVRTLITHQQQKRLLRNTSLIADLGATVTFSGLSSAMAAAAAAPPPPPPPLPPPMLDWFEGLVVIAIVAYFLCLNVAGTILVPSSPLPPDSAGQVAPLSMPAVEVVIACLSFFFLGELILRLIAFGPQYLFGFASFRIADSGLILANVIGTILTISEELYSPTSLSSSGLKILASWLRAVSLLRVVRVFKLLKRIKELPSIDVVLSALKSLMISMGDTTALLLLFLIIFSAAAISPLGPRMGQRCVSNFAALPSIPTNASLTMPTDITIPMTLNPVQLLQMAMPALGLCSSSSSSGALSSGCKSMLHTTADISVAGSIEHFICGNWFDTDAFPALMAHLPALSSTNTSGFATNVSAWALYVLLQFMETAAASSTGGAGGDGNASAPTTPALALASSLLGCNHEQACSLDGALGYQCPYGYVCLSGVTAGPYRGFLTYDNLMWSILQFFTCLSMELWYEIGYYARATIGPLGSLFMAGFALVVSQFVISVIVIVLCIEFEKERRQQQHRLALETAAGLRDRQSISIFQAAKGTGKRFQKLVKLLVKQKQEEEEKEVELERTMRMANGDQDDDDEDAEGSMGEGRVASARHQPRTGSIGGNSSSLRKGIPPGLTLFEFYVGQHCKAILLGPVFPIVVSLVITGSTVTLCLFRHELDAKEEVALTTALDVSSALFGLEALIRLCGTEQDLISFFLTPGEVFDLLVIIASALPWYNLQWIKCFRLPRVLYFLQHFFPRVLFWFEFAKAAIMRAPLIVMCLWLLVLVFGSMGKQIYGGMFCGDDVGDAADSTNALCLNKPRSNFDTFASAQITSFQILTSDNWNEVMYSAMRTSAAPVVVHALIFCVYYFLAAIIGLSLFSASMLSADANDPTVPDDDDEANEEDEGDGVISRLIEIAKRNAAKSAAKTEEEKAQEAGKIEQNGDSPAIVPEDASSQQETDTANQPPPTSSKEVDGKDNASFLLAAAATALAPATAGFTHARLFVRHMVELFWYRIFSSLVVILQSLSLALVDPIKPPDDAGTATLMYINIVATFFQTAETSLRIFAYGFIRGKDSFLQRSKWHIFDFFMLLLSVLSIVLHYTAADSSRVGIVVRSVLSLRPLLVMKLVPQVELVLISIIKAVLDLRPLLGTIFVFYIISAIAGTHLFAGQLFSCKPQIFALDGAVVSSLSQLNATECGLASLPSLLSGGSVNSTAAVNTSHAAWPVPGQWRTSQPNFDNVAESFFAVLFLSIMDGWTALMFELSDYHGPGQAPLINANQTSSAYLIGVVIVAGFVIPTLLSASLVRSYNKVKRQSTHKKSALEVSEKNAWLLSNRRLIRALPITARDRAINGFPGDDQAGAEVEGGGSFGDLVTGHVGRFMDQAVRIAGIDKHTTRAVESWTAFVHGDGFKLSCFAVSILSFICTAVQFFPATEALGEFLRATDIFFAAAFLAEAVVKIVCEGLQAYMAMRWNRLELFIAITTATLVGLEHQQKLSVCYSRSVRCFRVFRISRLARAISPHLQALLSSIGEAISQLIPVLCICFIFYSAYATAAVNIFGRLGYFGSYNPNTINPTVNFSSFWNAFSLLYRMSTGGKWHDVVMESAYDTSLACRDATTEAVRLGLCGPSIWVVRCFFSIWMVLSYYILNNLIIATLLDAFLCSANDRALTKDQALFATRAWLASDPAQSMALGPFDVLTVLRSMPARSAMGGFSSVTGKTRVSAELRFLAALGIVDPHTSRVPFRAFFDLLSTNAYDVAAAPRDRVIQYDFDAKYADFAMQILKKQDEEEAAKKKAAAAAAAERQSQGPDDTKSTNTVLNFAANTAASAAAMLGSATDTAAKVANTGANALKAVMSFTKSGAGMLFSAFVPDEILNEAQKSNNSAAAFFKSSNAAAAQALEFAMAEAMEVYRRSAAIIVINEFVRKWRLRRRAHAADLAGGAASPAAAAAPTGQQKRRILPFAIDFQPILDCLSDKDSDDDGDDSNDDAYSSADGEMVPILQHPL